MSRALFGPSKGQIWQQLANELGGRFTKQSWGQPGIVKVSVHQWTITLDTFVVSTGKSTITYTRMRAPYVNRDGFRFTIYRKTFFSAIGKLFGMTDIIVGSPEFEHLGPLFGLPSSLDRTEMNLHFADFDRDYIIQGNNVEQVRRLFASLHLRELIQSQPGLYLAVKDDEGWFGHQFPGGVDELYFQVVGIIADMDLLKALFELFSLLLERLCALGSAYQDAPGIEL